MDTTLSQITPHIYLSGIKPLFEMNQIYLKHKINFILSCVVPENMQFVHQQLLGMNPELTIVCLPYEDILAQNLWDIKKPIVLGKYKKTLESLYVGKYLIEIGFHFMEFAINHNQKILVHCMAGVSRSPSVVAYYLMKKYHTDLSNALKFIRKRRTIINPNKSFMIQLHFYQLYRQNLSKIIIGNLIDQKISLIN